MEIPMDVFPDLKFAIEWNRIILQFLGIWPNQKKSKTGKQTLNLNMLLAISFLLCFNASQITYLIMEWGQMDVVLEILSKAVVAVFVAMIKLISIWYNREVLKSLVASYAEDWMKIKNEQEREVMLKNARKGRILTLGNVILIITTLFIYISFRLYVSMQQRRRNVEDPTRLLVYESYFPFDTNESPNFELGCIIQSIGAAYAGTTNVATDTFIAILVLHLCTQLSNLRLELKNLVSEVNYEKGTGFRQKLAIIVSRHQHLTKYAQSIEETFNALLLVYVFFCTIQLCIIGYDFLLIFDNNESGQLSAYQVSFMVAYVISNALQLFIYCYVGEKLNFESTQLGYAAYECEWYKLNAREAQDLMFVMLRSKTPLKLTAGKFCSFSYPLFTTIIKTSMGYLSVLLTVRN